LLKIYGKSLIPTKAHIETLRLNARYQDDKIKAKQLLYIIAIQINNHSKKSNLAIPETRYPNVSSTSAELLTALTLDRCHLFM
jgi:hypothetical protein